jgi:hypothetical protein
VLHPGKHNDEAELIAFNVPAIDDDDFAAKAMQPVEALIGEPIAEHVVPTRRQDHSQRDYHKNMRPIVLQLIPLRASPPFDARPLR